MPQRSTTSDASRAKEFYGLLRATGDIFTTRTAPLRIGNENRVRFTSDDDTAAGAAAEREHTHSGGARPLVFLFGSLFYL